MLRKKIAKDPPPKAPENNNTSKPTISSTNLPKPSNTKIQPPKPSKDQINKDRIAQLVANKIRETKKENEIINKISAQMQANQKKKIQEYNGFLAIALKLSSLQLMNYAGSSELGNPLKQQLKKYAGQHFKSADYI